MISKKLQAEILYFQQLYLRAYGLSSTKRGKSLFHKLDKDLLKEGCDAAVTNVCLFGNQEQQRLPEFKRGMKIVAQFRNTYSCKACGRAYD